MAARCDAASPPATEAPLRRVHTAGTDYVRAEHVQYKALGRPGRRWSEGVSTR